MSSCPAALPGGSHDLCLLLQWVVLEVQVVPWDVVEVVAAVALEVPSSHLHIHQTEALAAMAASQQLPRPLLPQPTDMRPMGAPTHPPHTPSPSLLQPLVATEAIPKVVLLPTPMPSSSMASLQVVEPPRVWPQPSPPVRGRSWLTTRAAPTTTTRRPASASGTSLLRCHDQEVSLKQILFLQPCWSCKALFAIACLPVRYSA